MNKTDLDDLAGRIQSWSESLWEMTADDTGGFRKNADVPVNLLSSTDVAWIRHAMGQGDVAGGKRDAWVRFLRTRQDPRTGRFRYEPHAETNLSTGHALWHVVRSLNILGADLAHYPHYLADTVPLAGLEAFFDAVDWSGPPSNHHEVLGLSPLLVSLGDEQWTETFYRKLADQQDRQTGTWPAGRPINISRTYAYTVLYHAAGRMPAMPDRIVDAILATQGAEGFWNGPGFHTMDSAYLLIRLGGAIGHRRADATAALERLRAAMNELAATRLREVLRDTHGTLAVVETFSLLQEAFPRAYPAETAWRFDWTDTALYRSERIAAGPEAAP